VNHPSINGMQGVRGSKSPQLHQAQRIDRPPAQGLLSADCQQITCSDYCAVSVDP
jgi:hypothetical protein